MVRQNGETCHPHDSGTLLIMNISTSAGSAISSVSLAASATWLARATHITHDNVLQVILDDAADMKADGFDAVELPIPILGPIVPELTARFWQEVGGRLRDMGLTPLSVHGPNLPTLDADVTQTRAVLAPYATACAALGVDALVIHPTAHTHPHVCTVVPKLLSRDIELSLYLSDLLSDGATLLALENLPTYSLRYLQELMGKLDRKNIGVCLDTGHHNVRPEGSVTSFVRTFADRVAHLHLTDNHGLCDQHLPPGLGNFDYDAFFAALPSRWRRGPFLLELSAPLLMNDAEALSKTRAIHQEASRVGGATVSRAIARAGSESV